MKKTTTIILAVMLLLSVVPVMAESDIEDSANVSVKDKGTLRETLKEVRKERKEQREELREELKGSFENAREENKQNREEIKELRNELRIDFKEQRKNAREDFKQMREAKNPTALRVFLETKTQIRLDAKERREELREKTKEDREELKSDRRETRVSAATSLMVNALEHADTLLVQLDAELGETSANATAEASTDAEEEQDRIAQLRTELSVVQEKASLLSTNSTNEEIKQTLGEVRELLKKVKQEVKIGLEHKEIVQFHGLFKKLENAEKKLSVMLERAKNKGIDVTQFAESEAKIKVVLKEAKDLVVKARAEVKTSNEKTRAYLQ
ncbi:MAG: hypothetical protein Q7K43_00540, partial [Candidatus Woesearchaeota archaeon]|nr:hypothetical protein [Candidatus Woesearchaeota archaeon]